VTDDSRAGAVLYAKDMDKVASFYAAVLSLTAVDRDDEHVLLESPAFQLVIRAMPAHVAATIQIAAPPARRADAVVKLVFFVPSIAAVCASVSAHGGVMDKAAKSWSFHGWNLWDGLDPEGNVIQFRFRADAV
jgi:predicted enzyme related to lactoylglutathione lyase